VGASLNGGGGRETWRKKGGEERERMGGERAGGHPVQSTPISNRETKTKIKKKKGKKVNEVGFEKHSTKKGGGKGRRKKWRW